LAGKKPNTVQVAEQLIAPVLAEHGLILWDARFEKEGSQWYLRYFIDREDGGVTIQDCEKVSRAVDKLLDAADPIEQSYILEVGSPGIERELTKDWHFGRYTGYEAAVRLIRPVGGKRDFIGLLEKKDGKTVTLLLRDETEMAFNVNDAAYIRLYADFDDGGKRG
jgi:ribosome maturation factor RimP